MEEWGNESGKGKQPLKGHVAEGDVTGGKENLILLEVSEWHLNMPSEVFRLTGWAVYSPALESH